MCVFGLDDTTPRVLGLVAEHDEDVREFLGDDVVVAEVRALVGAAEVGIPAEPALVAEVPALVVAVEHRVERGSHDGGARHHRWPQPVGPGLRAERHVGRLGVRRRVLERQALPGRQEGESRAGPVDGNPCRTTIERARMRAEGLCGAVSRPAAATGASMTGTMPSLDGHDRRVRQGPIVRASTSRGPLSPAADFERRARATAIRPAPPAAA